MPNQLNYPGKISNTEFQRPTRIRSNDLQLLLSGSQQILFGTSDNDVVELWVYNPDGSFASHINLPPTDPALSLTTLIDQSGAKELLNIDVYGISTRMGLNPGRYSFVVNFLRNEVGAEQSYKLFISEISTDRTELKLTPVEMNDKVSADVYEFVTPSVPRIFAQGLIDEMFGVSLDVNSTEMISQDKILNILDELEGNISDRIIYSDSSLQYQSMVNKIIARAHSIALDNMANDKFNNAIQEIEILNYIEKALDVVIYGMVQSGEIDPRFLIK